MFFLLLSCSPIETTGGQADAWCSSVAAPRGSVGVSHVSQLSRHMFRAIFGACIALPQIIFIPSVKRRVRFRRIFGTFFSMSLPRIWLSRSTSKIDALDDDETERGQAAVRCSRKSAVLGSAGKRLPWPPKAAILNSDL